jgi:hypothetical protein
MNLSDRWLTINAGPCRDPLGSASFGTIDSIKIRRGPRVPQLSRLSPPSLLFSTPQSKCFVHFELPFSAPVQRRSRSHSVVPSPSLHTKPTATQPRRHSPLNNQQPTHSSKMNQRNRTSSPPSPAQRVKLPKMQWARSKMYNIDDVTDLGSCSEYHGVHPTSSH